MSISSFLLTISLEFLGFGGHASVNFLGSFRPNSGNFSGISMNVGH